MEVKLNNAIGSRRSEHMIEDRHGAIVLSGHLLSRIATLSRRMCYNAGTSDSHIHFVKTMAAILLRIDDLYWSIGTFKVVGGGRERRGSDAVTQQGTNSSGQSHGEGPPKPHAARARSRQIRRAQPSRARRGFQKKERTAGSPPHQSDACSNRTIASGSAAPTERAWLCANAA